MSGREYLQAIKAELESGRHQYRMGESILTRIRHLRLDDQRPIEAREAPARGAENGVCGRARPLSRVARGCPSDITISRFDQK